LVFFGFYFEKKLKKNKKFCFKKKKKKKLNLEPEGAWSTTTSQQTCNDTFVRSKE